jgi:hypothetical protein
MACAYVCSLFVKMLIVAAVVGGAVSVLAMWFLQVREVMCIAVAMYHRFVY